MPRISKEFYDQDPRAAQLRNVCLEAYAASIALTSGETDGSGAIGAILDANVQLAQLGIITEMHRLNPEDPDVTAKRARLVASPQLTAEWVAGQMKAVLEECGGHEYATDAEALIAESNITPDNEVFSLIDTRTASPAMKQLLLSAILLADMRAMLDPSAGPSDIASPA